MYRALVSTRGHHGSIAGGRGGEPPAGEDSPEDVVGVDLPTDEEPVPDEEAAQQDVEAEDSAWASAIDPSLLEAESGRKRKSTPWSYWV